MAETIECTIDESHITIDSSEKSIEIVDLSAETTYNEEEANNDGFVDLDIIEGGNTYVADEASIVLAQCKKYIVFPYNLLLKLIGWRKIQTSQDSCPMLLRVINILYPSLIFFMLFLACVAQVISCFSRTRAAPPTELDSGYYILSCNSHVFTLGVIPYIMILLSYILALYTFRIAESEHLSSLAETVLLSFTGIIRNKSRRKPLVILLGILFCGLGFVIFSIIVTIFRLFSLRLHKDDTIIAWFTKDVTAENQSEVLKLSLSGYNGAHYSLVAISIFGFLFFDLLYIAVTINYCSQCQLLTYYIENIQEKVRNKKYGSLDLAIKEIRQVYNFLKILNGKISLVSSLIFIVLVSNVILSYAELTKVIHDDLNIATGFLNTIQWLIAVIFPALMAARLTSSGNELRRLGQEIAVRPFYYSNSSDLELQFFLNFTESTRYQVTLLFIPMHPSLILGFCYILLVCIASGQIIGQVESVSWF